MNWEAIGAIGEILGAIGVFASLIYLALQIRSNSKQMLSQNINSQTTQSQQTMALQANPELLSTIEKAYVTGEELVARDYVLLEAYLTSGIAPVRADFLHYKNGLISGEEWERRLTNTAPWFDSPVALDMWKAGKLGWEPDFVEEIDRMLERKDVHGYRIDPEHGIAPRNRDGT